MFCSDETKYSKPKYQYKAENRLNNRQKDFSKKKKDSNNYEKARIKLAIGYENILASICGGILYGGTCRWKNNCVNNT